MIREVAKENWLYHDRGMMKWMGFFMSDHTVYMDQQKDKEAAERPLPQMASASIDRLLQQSWQKTTPLSLQVDRGDHYQTVEGIVIGYEQDLVYLQGDSGLMTIQFAHIRHVTLKKAEKWWSA
ncbi:hypothetical protein HC026_11860 [Lactobacillus sp. LC28-10]|uniref:DNA-directed RNA polymerase beta subunit n=1 Tax=Secundilactobacillus angelensis TaxID=2722706 RepID=A0ABX1L2D3_9LACO|nr:hypothetical protein [Secundilactobacillus angelensis]MCH5461332.1 hypothetical protein [Secundilactobacillus angelensis]NLR19584.1 hypothetical protein [Secundilactobacillus angelensis]